MSALVGCDGPECSVTAPAQTTGWLHLTNVKPPVSDSDQFDFHDPGCLLRWSQDVLTQEDP